IGFMPEALSIKAQPYRHNWPTGTLWTGWAYPPKDQRKWAELIYRWVTHEVERYGKPEVESWLWEVWNEPNIGYWQSTPQEYQKLYDCPAGAVKRAPPSARLGGPHSTGPSSDQAADLLRRSLEHCARGTNCATGRTGSPLDYVGFHAKGRPRVVEGRVQMGISKQLQDISRGFEIAASFPEFCSLPIIIGESDPEGCAACSARGYPQNAYRNGALYPAYSAAVFRGTLDLAQRHRVNLQGAVTWAVEFEDQPYFDGFRTLATNGVDKPVLNVFRMLGMMRGERIKAESSGGVDLDGMMRNGVQGKPAIDVLATRDGRQISILVWDYHDDDVPGPAADVEVDVGGL